MAGHRVPYVSDKLAAKVIGAGEKVSAYLLLTLLMKAFFAATLADVHTHVLLTAREDLEKERQSE